MNTPIDNELMKEKYEDKICGQSCLAILEDTTIENIMNQWENFFGEFKGYTSYRDLITFIKNIGYSVKRKKKIESREFIYIARVQWLGNGKKQDKPYYGWNSWYEASCNTHYIIFLPKEGKFYCNGENRWRNILDIESYLKSEGKGVITSILEIR